MHSPQDPLEQIVNFSFDEERSPPQKLIVPLRTRLVLAKEENYGLPRGISVLRAVSPPAMSSHRPAGQIEEKLLPTFFLWP